MEAMMLIVSEGHWLAVHVRWTEDMLLALFPDARTGTILAEVRSFFQAFQKALGKTYFELNRTNLLVQRKDSICRALAIVTWHGSLGSLWTLTMKLPRQLLKWRTFAPTGEGNSYQVIPEWLKTFLCEKGVSKEKVEQRIGKALKAISLSQTIGQSLAQAQSSH